MLARDNYRRPARLWLIVPMMALWGNLHGGFIIGITEAFAGYYIDPSLKDAVWFMVFIVVLIVRPSGLFGRAGAEEFGFRGQA